MSQQSEVEATTLLACSTMADEGAVASLLCALRPRGEHPPQHIAMYSFRYRPFDQERLDTQVWLFCEATKDAAKRR